MNKGFAMSFKEFVIMNYYKMIDRVTKLKLRITSYFKHRKNNDILEVDSRNGKNVFVYDDYIAYKFGIPANETFAFIAKKPSFIKNDNVSDYVIFVNQGFMSSSKDDKDVWFDVLEEKFKIEQDQLGIHSAKNNFKDKIKCKINEILARIQRYSTFNMACLRVYAKGRQKFNKAIKRALKSVKGHGLAERLLNHVLELIAEYRESEGGPIEYNLYAL